jgi:hypothetical protein
VKIADRVAARKGRRDIVDEEALDLLDGPAAAPDHDEGLVDVVGAEAVAMDDIAALRASPDHVGDGCLWIGLELCR